MFIQLSYTSSIHLVSGRCDMRPNTQTYYTPASRNFSFFSFHTSSICCAYCSLACSLPLDDHSKRNQGARFFVALRSAKTIANMLSRLRKLASFEFATSQRIASGVRRISYIEYSRFLCTQVKCMHLPIASHMIRTGVLF